MFLEILRQKILVKSLKISHQNTGRNHCLSEITNNSNAVAGYWPAYTAQLFQHIFTQDFHHKPNLCSINDPVVALQVISSNTKNYLYSQKLCDIDVQPFMPIWKQVF